MPGGGLRANAPRVEKEEKEKGEEKEEDEKEEEEEGGREGGRLVARFHRAGCSPF